MNNFTLAYDTFEPAEEGLREALTSTGNGYFCTRGACEWQDADDVHYPGTYARAAYNRETTILQGQPVPNEDLVNLPNLAAAQPANRGRGSDRPRQRRADRLSPRIRPPKRTRLRDMRFRDRAGRQTRLRSRRFVSMAHVHQAGLEWTITPENWSGRVEVVSALDGRVTNRGVARYRQLAGRHLDPVSPRTFGPEVIALRVRTRQSTIYVAEAARTRVFRGSEQLEPARTLYQMEDYIQQALSFDMSQDAPVRVEKLVAFYTSYDRAISEPLGAAGKSARRYPGFEEALRRHSDAWDELRRACDMQLPGEPRGQLLPRLHTAHILQVCSRLTADLDAGVPARGLNGEAYRGHVFWDELYVYPFLNMRLPEITRELLMYRFRRLGQARAAADEAGYRGAMFPVAERQRRPRGDAGRAPQPAVGPLGPGSEPQPTARQRRDLLQRLALLPVTGDIEFIRDYGAKMMLEIARFWASIAHYNPERDRYEIHGVMGPHEFHEKYPGSAEGGLRNNAYTNVMVVWIADIAQQVLDLLPERRQRALRDRLCLTEEELETWRAMARKMFVPFHDDGVISQFEGYEALKDLDWDYYRARHGKIQRLDRILKAERDDPDDYKLSKQADAVMLFFLFSEDELRDILERLGYEYAPDGARNTIDYYDRRTSHGSTLSFITHAGVLAGLDPERSWERFLVALESDVGDVQGGTTKEGIHMGVMSGTLDLVQRRYLGTSIRDGAVSCNPRLLDHLDGLTFSMQFRGAPLRVRIAARELTVLVPTEGFSGAVRVGVGEELRELGAGEQCIIALARTTAAAH